MSKSNRGPGPGTPGQSHLPPALSSLLGPGPRADLSIPIEIVADERVPPDKIVFVPPKAALQLRATAYGVRKAEHGWEAVRYTILPDGVKAEVVHQAEPHPAPAYAYAANAVHEEYARKSAGLDKY